MTTKVRSCEATRSIRCDLQMERENWPSLRAGKVLKFSLKNLGALKREEGTRTRPPVISRERTNRITAWRMDGFKLWVQVEATDSNSFVIDHNALSNGKTGLSLPSSLILHLYIPDIYSNLERGCPRKGGQIFPNFSYDVFLRKKREENLSLLLRDRPLCGLNLSTLKIFRQKFSRVWIFIEGGRRINFRINGSRALMKIHRYSRYWNIRLNLARGYFYKVSRSRRSKFNL